MIGCSLQSGVRRAAYVLAALWLAACTTPPATVQKETSAPTKPAWITQVPKQGDQLYFLGVKTCAESFDEAQEAAVRHALSEVAAYLGTTVQSMITEKSTDVSEEFRHDLSAKATAQVLGAKVVDTYYEKMTRNDGKLQLQRFDLYVLVSYPRAAVAAERERQGQEALDRVKAAHGLYVQGQAKEKAQDYQGAADLYQRALVDLARVDQVVAMKEPGFETSAQLKVELETRRAAAAARLKRVKVVCAEGARPDEQKAFAAALGAVLATGGYTITEEAPALTLACELRVQKSSVVMDKQVYAAGGSVSVRRVADGQVIATVPFIEKGFHVTPERAAYEAASTAGNSAGKAVAKALGGK